MKPWYLTILPLIKKLYNIDTENMLVVARGRGSKVDEISEGGQKVKIFCKLKPQ